MDVVGRAFAEGQLAAAFVTALSHEDPHTRRRADTRVRQWRSVLSGMGAGTLDVGSRTPVAGLPAWVTPEVVRGGFATGSAAAEGELDPDEHALAARAGVAPNRSALFAYLVGDPGLAELAAMLDSGRFDAAVPEQTALLTVAWLLRAGDRLAALTLLAELAPFADRLRFAPRPAPEPAPDPQVVSRATVGEVTEALQARRPNERIDTMRETLLVWHPFRDDVVALWLTGAVDGRVGLVANEPWHERARELVERYEVLRVRHTRSRTFLRPDKNLPVLLEVTRQVLAHGSLAEPLRRRAQYVVDCLVRKHGTPGSAAHARLRREQAREAALPTHLDVAQVLLRRLAGHPPAAGLRAPEELLGPVTEAEAEHATGPAPAESPVPAPLGRVVRRALAARVEDLVAAGVVPSAEVLAGLVPAVAAATTAAAYRDPSLQRLVATTYRAFRRRRSLLLLDLARQVQVEELPWVQAVAPYRRATAQTRGTAEQAARRLGTLALTGFPGSVLPNPLVRELGALAREAGVRAPFTEELAADIFQGRFSPTFTAAARLAAALLRGSPYQRYFDIDPAAISVLPDPSPPGRDPLPDHFAVLCTSRAGVERVERFVVANGMVIEQAQILTTHNLAVLVSALGVEPDVGWPGLVLPCWEVVVARVREAQRSPRPLRAVKNAAYAWRQLVFFLSMAPDHVPQALAEMRAALDTRPVALAARLAPVLGGLADIADGDRFDGSGRSPHGRRLLGWSSGRHWLTEPTAGPAG